MDEIAWMGLYPLAVALMQEKRPRPPEYSDRALEAFAAQDTQWGMVRRFYYRMRLRRFNSMRRFLDHWEISPQGTPQSRNGADHEEDRKDERVLGLHEFYRREHVADYIHRWQDIPNLRNEVLRQNHCMLSRAVDLICSELVANAFDHGNRDESGAPVRVLAKVCDVSSCARDLALDSIYHHLSDSEHELYEFCLKKGMVHLQFIVSDGGRGFGGNDDLIALWRRATANSVPSEAELIKFALRGDVTTKSPHRIYLNWHRSMTQRRDYWPQVHGLSEVLQTVMRLRALWRIHSGKECVEYAALKNAALTRDTGRELPAMSVKGCLHYFAIPLFPQNEASSPVHSIAGWSGTKDIPPRSCVIDLAEYVVRKNASGSRPASDKDLRLDLPRLWDTLCAIQVENVRCQIVFYLRVIGIFKDTTRLMACAAVLDCITRLGSQFIPILAGLDVAGLSAFRRFMGPGTFLGNARVIPALLWTEARPAESVDLLLGPEAAKVEGEIRRLVTRTNAEVLRSEVSGETWNILQAVVSANPALLCNGKASLDDCVRLQFDTPLDLDRDPTLQRLADTSISFQTLRQELESASAVLRLPPESKYPLVRLGQVCEYYMHLGRLVADESIRAAIIRCFLMHLQAPATLPHLNREPKDFEFLALLHPAIEIAQAMAAVQPFNGTNVVAVRRRADVRFDHGTLIALAGKSVVLVVDMVHTGELARSMLSTLTRLDVTVLALLAIVNAHPEPHIDTLPIRSFCRCTEQELDLLGTVPNRLLPQ